MDELRSVSLFDYLEDDHQPTFVLDLSSIESGNRFTLDPIFQNRASLSNLVLTSYVRGEYRNTGSAISCKFCKTNGTFNSFSVRRYSMSAPFSRAQNSGRPATMAGLC